MRGDEPRVRFVGRVAVARQDHANHSAGHGHLAEPRDDGGVDPPAQSYNEAARARGVDALLDPVGDVHPTRVHTATIALRSHPQPS